MKHPKKSPEIEQPAPQSGLRDFKLLVAKCRIKSELDADVAIEISRALAEAYVQFKIANISPKTDKGVKDSYEHALTSLKSLKPVKLKTKIPPPPPPATVVSKQSALASKRKHSNNTSSSSSKKEALSSAFTSSSHQIPAPFQHQLPSADIPIPLSQSSSQESTSSGSQINMSNFISTSANNLPPNPPVMPQPPPGLFPPNMPQLPPMQHPNMPPVPQFPGAPPPFFTGMPVPPFNARMPINPNN